MKNTKYIFSALFVLILAACAGPTAEIKTNVTIQVKFFTWTDENNDVNYPTEFRIIGDFNNWGNGAGTTKEAIWSQAVVMNWNQSKEAFEATISVPKGKPIEYTFMSKHTNHTTKAQSFFGWETLQNLYYSESKEWIFSPFDKLVDNRVGNGGTNAYYMVP